MPGNRDVELAKLFYTIEAKTGGLHRELASAEKSLGRLASFVRANPVAALGALGAAAVAAGLKAAAMAEQFDAGVRRIAAVIPGGADAVRQLTTDIEALAAKTGKSAAELSQAGLVIGRAGLTGPQEFADRLELVSKVADATATDMSRVAQDIDLVLDVFGLSADKAGEVAAKLVAAGKGKFEWESLTAAIQAVAPAVQDAGLGFDEAVGFLAHWVEAGRTGKQSARELKEALKSEIEGQGAEALRRFGHEALNTAAAMRQLDDAARVVSSSSERLTGQLKEQWASRTREIGRAISEGILNPMREVLLLATDPFFSKPPEAGGRPSGHLEGAIFDVLSGPARQAAIDKARRDAALAAATGPAELPDLVVKALTPEEQQRLRDRAEAFAADVRRALAAATAALADDLALVLEEFRQRYRDVYDGLTEQERRLAEQRLRFLENQLRVIRDFEAEPAPTVAPRALDTTTRAALDLRPLGDDVTKAALDEIARRVERIKKGEQETADAARERRQELERSVAELQRGIRGAVQLGEAFGILDANLGHALESVSDIAGSIKLIAGGAGSLSTWLGLAGGISGFLTGLLGGGPTPQQLESQRIQQANTDALREVAKVVGEWSAQITGTQASTAARVSAGLLARADDFTRPGPRGSTVVQADEFRRTLQQDFGLSLRELRELAAEFNVEIDTSTYQALIHSLKKLNEVVQQTELTRFAQTWAGQLEQLNLEFDLFDITDPLEQLKRLQELAQTGPVKSDALQTITRGLDLATQAGRTEADRRIRELFLAIRAGQLTPEQLGGLTPGELEAALRDLERLLDTIAEQQGELTGGQPIQATFGRESVITEATGSQIAGLLLSSDLKLGQLVELSAALLEAVIRPIEPPALALAGGGGAVLEVTATFTVHVAGDLPAAEAEVTGALVGQAAADTLDAELAKRLRAKQLAAGAVMATG